MAANVVGRLRTDLICNYGRFVTGMKQAGIATTQFGLQVRKSALAVTSFAKSMGAGFGLGAIGVTYSLVRVARSVEEFNQAMASSTAIMGKLSDAMRTKLVKAAQDVAYATKFSAVETAKAYYYLTSAGLTAAQSIKALPTVATFAQAGMFDLARATDLLTDAQMALGLSSKDAAVNMENMTRVSDVLVKANVLANASVEQFSEALTNKAGAALRLVNKDIEEGVAVLAAFASRGVKGAEAGTAMAIVMRDLQTKAIENAAAFKKFNVEVYDRGGQMRNIAAIVRDLEQAMKGLNDRSKKQLLLGLGFSDKSVAYVSGLIGASVQIREYEAALRKAGGTSLEVAEKQLPPLTKGFGKLTDAIKQMAQGTEGPLANLGKLLEFIADQMKRTDKQIALTAGSRRIDEIWKNNRAMYEKIAPRHTNWDGSLDIAGFLEEYDAAGKSRARRAALLQKPDVTELDLAGTKDIGSGKLLGLFGKVGEVIKSKLNASFMVGSRAGFAGVRGLQDASAWAGTGMKRIGAAADEARLAARQDLSSIFQRAPELQFAGGAGRGSQEAYSAIVRAMGQDETKRAALTMQRQQLIEARKAGYTLTEIRNHLGGEGVNLDQL